MNCLNQIKAIISRYFFKTNELPELDQNDKDILKMFGSEIGNHFVISEYSILIFMAIVYLDANDNFAIRRKIEDLFNFPFKTISVDEMKRFLMSKMKLENPIKGILTVSNGFFKRSDAIETKDDFNKFFKYVGRMESKIDVDEINQWVDDTTKGLIKQLYENIAESVQKVIVNIIYFDMKWRQFFDFGGNHMRIFNKLGGEQVEQLFMKKHETCKYWSNNDMEMIEMLYEDNDYCFDVFLQKHPSDDVTAPKDQKNGFGMIDIQKCVEKLDKVSNNQIVEIIMPRFEIRTKVDISSVLNKISPNIFDGYCISHQAIIVFDEEGTMACAITGGLVDKCARIYPKHVIFIADRTFNFAIRHLPSKTVLFTGVYDGK